MDSPIALNILVPGSPPTHHARYRSHHTAVIVPGPGRADRGRSDALSSSKCASIAVTKLTMKPLSMERSLVFCIMFSLFAVISAPALAHDHTEGTMPLGKPGDPAHVKRSVRIDMSDAMRFIPDKIMARKGETIRFIVRNTGQVQHEFVLGDAKVLREHAELMKKFPGMKHTDPNQLTVAPGMTADLFWQFTRAGVIDFACLSPGHYEAGMRGKISVK